jgi:hypothetical protein
MIDAETTEILTSAGVSQDTLPRLDLFASVARPDSIEGFFDPTPAAPVSLTVGQVQTLRGALRGQVANLVTMLQMQVEMGDLAVLLGLIPQDLDAQRDLTAFLDLEDALSASYAGSTAVVVPDSLPDEWLS